MKTTCLLLMSLFSLLFGCRDKKNTSSLPAFPNTTNADLTIAPVALDSGYIPQAFFMEPEHQRVFVLAYRHAEPDPRNPYSRNWADYRLLSLDEAGQVQKRLDWPDSDLQGAASIGMLEGRLHLIVYRNLLTIDPDKMVVTGKTPIYNDRFFPSKIPLDEMTFDELRDHYAEALTAALEHATAGRWLQWTPQGPFFALLTDKKGKISLWEPQTYDEENLDFIRKRFPDQVVTVAPAMDTALTDGSASLRVLKHEDAGSQLVYPNYKSRTRATYELVLKNKSARFTTSNRDGHALYLWYAVNGKLVGSDGAAWVAYEDTIYRMW